MKFKTSTSIILCLILTIGFSYPIYAAQEINIIINPQVTTAHIVRSGDTLFKISKLFKIKYKEIMKNSGLGSTIIYRGQELYIPSRDIIKGEANTYTVKKEDTLYSIGNLFGKHYENLSRFNKIKNPHLIYTYQKIKIPTH